MTTLHDAASQRRSVRVRRATVSRLTVIGSTACQMAVVAAVWTAWLRTASLVEAAGWGTLAASFTMMPLIRRTRGHRIIRSHTDDIGDVASAIGIGAVSTLAAAAATGRLLPLDRVVPAALTSLIVLLVLRSLAARSQTLRPRARRLVVVGTGEEGAELAQLVIEHPEAAFDLIGVVGNRTMAEVHGLGPLLLGDVADLTTILADHSIDAAIITPTGFRVPQFRRIMTITREADVAVMLSSGVGRIAVPRYRVSSLVHEPLLALGWDTPSRRRVAQRSLDVTGAILGLFLAAPVMVVAAVAVWAHDRGPILYRSERIGRDHQPFAMLKFRTMRPDADTQKNDLAERNERSGPLFKLRNDPRVTPVGRLLRETSIDELPQLINVVRGEMSLVGPRPALPEEFERFDDELRARFGVHPGMTGLWQVEARSNGEFGAYRRLDLHYVANTSLLLDLQIILATVIQVVTSSLLLVVHPWRGTTDRTAPETVAPVIDIRHPVERRTGSKKPPSSLSARS